jgi:arylsulfatase A-like enzyme
VKGRFIWTALGLSAGACGEPAPEVAAQSSVLLITLDTTRTDALSCYGARADTTPELNRLARESVLYERAFTPAPITLSAHASLLTGLYPLRHGLRDNGIAALDPEAHTLAEAARAAGIQTAAFVGAVVLDRALGLDQGFETYDGPTAARSTSGHPLERSAANVVDAALDWLERRDRARPFFLWLHFYDAHHPYTPRSAAAGASELERYLAEVSEVDTELGRLFGALRGAGLFDSTLVCVTADHGEAFGEHQELTHGAYCWNTTLHVPLLLRFPAGARGGERSRELVSLVDVAPTLAEALGVTLGPDVDGRSLGAPREPGLYFESYTGYLAFGWSPLAGWMDEQGKYVASSRPEFFDLARDPGEERDLAAEKGAALEPYRAAIGRLAARPALRGAGPEGALDSDLRADIADLGYAAAQAVGSDFPHPLEPNQRPSPHERVGAWRESMVAKEKINRGRIEEGATLLTRLVGEDPNNGFLRGELASAWMKLKRFEDAYEVLRPLAEPPLASTTHAQNFYKLGVCAVRLGRGDEAQRHLERAVELAPHEARYKVKLEQVRGGAAGNDEGE